MDIFIVFVLNSKDGSRAPYWIDADGEADARRKALKLLGRGSVEIVGISLLGKLATSMAAKTTKRGAKKKK